MKPVFLDNLSFSHRIRELEQKIEHSDDAILDMTFGYPVNLHADWMDEILNHLDADTLKKVPAKTLKNSIENYFRNIFQQPNILLTTSASEALLLAIHACIVNKDDEIMLLDYGFYSYPELIRSGKGKPVFIPRNTKNHLDIDRIENYLSDKTRALLITQPENPLGGIFTQTEMENLCLFCIKNKLTLIVDHAFIESDYFGEKINLLTQLDYNRFLKDLSWIIIGDTGKIVCFYGIKCGCLLMSDNLKQLLAYWHHLIVFQVNLVQMFILSNILYDSRFNNYKADLYNTVRNNLLLLKAQLDSRIHILCPQATPMVMLDISHFLIDDLTFVERMLEEEKVALMPGCYFIQGAEENKNYPNSQVRIAISRSQSEIEQAIVRINRFVLKLKYT